MTWGDARLLVFGADCGLPSIILAPALTPPTHELPPGIVIHDLVKEYFLTC